MKRIVVRMLAPLALTFFSAFTHSQVIRTIAGGHVGDGGQAVDAGLNQPSMITVDSAGNLYIADRYNNRIRKIASDGIITTIAGSGTSGYSGDNGPATQAQLNFPYGIAIDSLGNLYVADTGNDRIRRVDTHGVITTVAGNGTEGYFGDGGVALEAEFDHPDDVASDSYGNVYVADTGNNRIRKVGINGVVTTYAGNGQSGYFGDGGPATEAALTIPIGVAVDSQGNVYVSDDLFSVVRKIDVNGIITTVAGGGSNGLGDGGLATDATLWGPHGLAFDADANLYVADAYNMRIRKIATDGIITSVAGDGAYGFSGDGGSALNAELALPVGLAITGSGSIYVADRDNFRVRMLSPSGVITTVAGTGPYYGDGDNATNAQLNLPEDVIADPNGNLYVSDAYNNRVRKITVGGVISTVAGNGIQGYAGDGGTATTAELNAPQGIAIDDDGNLYIADQENNCIRKISTQGIITTVAGNGTNGFAGDGGPATTAELSEPYAVAIDNAGNIFISDWGNYRIREVDTNGTITTIVGNGIGGLAGDGGPASEALVDQPRGLAFDNLGNLFIADYGNACVRKVDLNGIITTVAGTGMYGYSGDGGLATSAQLFDDTDIAVDASGNLYIADTANSRIRKVSTDGIITTIAGTTISGFSGDGGPASKAQLNLPDGIAIGSNGALFIADTYNNRIREVLPDSIFANDFEVSGSNVLN